MISNLSELKNWSQTDAARLLVSNDAMAGVTTADAREFVKRMRACVVPLGTVLFREGDSDADFMVFILSGDAVVEGTALGHSQGTVFKVLGPGALIGELGVVDNNARSATVVADSDMVLMDQAAFTRLIVERPDLACKFLGSMLRTMSARLRDSNRRVQMLDQLSKTLNDELAAMKSHGQVADGN